MATKVCSITLTPRDLSGMIRDGDIKLVMPYGLDRSAMSVHVDTVLAGLPLPPVMLEGHTDGTYTILSGAVRVVALAEYYDGCYALDMSGDDALTDCDGLRIDDLAITIQRKYRNYALQVIVLCGLSENERVKLSIRKD